MSFKYSSSSWSTSSSSSNKQVFTTQTITTRSSDGLVTTETITTNGASALEGIQKQFKNSQLSPNIEDSKPLKNRPIENSKPFPTRSIESPKPSFLSRLKFGSKSDSNFTQFECECLDEHNRLRAKHGCPPLELDRAICNFAKEWANHLARQNTLQHRSERTYGENLFMAGGQQVDGTKAVKNWYDEITNYNFRNGRFSGSTGHFTQVIWKGSRKLGVAFEQRGSSVWVVANYSPAGNVMGQFEENVLPPK